MLRVQKIDSFDTPDLAPYSTMRYQEEHRRQGIFVAENEKVVRRLIDSNIELLSVVLPEKWASAYEQLLRDRDITLYIGAKSLLESLAGFPMYQGVMAIGRVPPQPSLETIIATAPRPILFVAADGLSNSQNMGALTRNCAAFGVSALLCSQTSCSPFLRRSVASSMGAIFTLPALELPDLPGTLKQLRASGIRCIAAHPHADGRTLTSANFQTDCCIAFGSEGEGITPAVLEQCDEAVEIAMANNVDSLNVASASSVFLYEASRQRTYRK